MLIQKLSLNTSKKFKDRAEKMGNTYTTISQEMLGKKLTGRNLHGYLTLKAGVASSEAALKWCDEALRLLKMKIINNNFLTAPIRLLHLLYLLALVY